MTIQHKFGSLNVMMNFHKVRIILCILLIPEEHELIGCYIAKHKINIDLNGKYVIATKLDQLK